MLETKESFRQLESQLKTTENIIADDEETKINDAKTELTNQIETVRGLLLVNESDKRMAKKNHKDIEKRLLTIKGELPRSGIPSNANTDFTFNSNFANPDDEIKNLEKELSETDKEFKRSVLEKQMTHEKEKNRLEAFLTKDDHTRTDLEPTLTHMVDGGTIAKNEAKYKDPSVRVTPPQNKQQKIVIEKTKQEHRKPSSFLPAQSATPLLQEDKQGSRGEKPSSESIVDLFAFDSSASATLIEKYSSRTQSPPLSSTQSAASSFRGKRVFGKK